MVNRMHVLFFHQYFATPACASGLRSYEQAQELLRKGHQVTMVCVSEGYDLGLGGKDGDFIRKGKVDGIDVIQFNLIYSNHLSLLRRAWIFLSYALCSVYYALTLKYDLLFATSTPLTVAIPGIFARYLKRKKFVFEVRDLWPELPRAMGVVTNPLVLGAMSFLELMAYRSATACVALSPGIKEGILRRSPPGKEVIMIPNGCDLEIFVPGKRVELDLPDVAPTDCVAVFTGAHGIANGLYAVLDAAAVLKDRHREDIKLYFIGDGKLKPALVERAQHEKLDNCYFLNPVPKTMLAKIINCADVGMMILDNIPAFYYGTSPNKFFDYISSGLPVLNNYPGWLADMIEEHKCGIAVPPGDPQAFADALCFLADNPQERRDFGKNSRKLAKQQFSRNQQANRFVTFLEKIHTGVINCRKV
jgi:glycosyltransferase involved in cell wall biosynthesis